MAISVIQDCTCKQYKKNMNMKLEI